MNNQDKKKKFSLMSLMGRSKMRYGTFTAILIAVVLVAVILINVAAGAIENNWALSIDLTATKVTDFSDATYQVLNELDQDVHVYTVFRDGTSNSTRIQLEEIVNKYHALNKHVKVENINPETNPTLITKYAGTSNVSEGSLIVTNADETRVKYVAYSDLYSSYTSSFTNRTQQVFVAENRLTSALLYVSSENTPRVFFLTGHGELDSEKYCTVFTDQMKNENYDVATLDMTTSDVELAAGDTMIVVDPKRDLTDEQYETLRAWMDQGGRLLFSLSYDVDKTPLVNFMKLLAYYGLAYEDGQVIEAESASSNWTSATYMLVPNMDAEHEVTAQLVTDGKYLCMPNCRPIAPVEMPESGITYTNILTSSNKATVQNGDEVSLPGTKILAQTASKTYYDDKTQTYDSNKDVRIALLSNYYTLADTSLLNYSYNMDFTMSLMSWLVNRDVSVSVYSKTIADTTLRIPDSATAWTLAAIVVIAIPLIFLIAGIVVWVKRRRL